MKTVSMSCVSIFLVLFLCVGTSVASPSVVGSCSLPEGSYGGLHVNDIHVSERGYAFVATAYNGVMIVDARDPAGPAYLGSADISWAMDVATSGDHAYVAGMSPYGLTILDIANPGSPVVMGGVQTGGSGNRVMAAGNYAYLVVDDDTIRTIDISNPSRPFQVSEYDASANGDIHSYAFSFPYIYAVTYSGDILVYDVGASPFPNLIATLDATTDDYLGSLDVSGFYLYLTSRTDVLDSEGGVVQVCTLHAIDVRDPVHPTVVGSFDNVSPDGWGFVYASDHYAYVISFEETRIFSIRDPENITRVGDLRVGQTGGFFADDLHAYVVAEGMDQWGVPSLNTFQVIGLDPPEIPPSANMAPAAPSLGLITTGPNLAAFWAPVENALGYTLFYAPHPGASPIGSLDIGSRTTFSADLPRGASFYMALQAYNDSGAGGISNVDFFTIEEAAPMLSGAWQGSWSNYTGDETGNFTVHLTRSVLSLSGTLDADTGSAACPRVTAVPIGGILSSDGARVDFSANTVCGDAEVSFEFARGAITGTTITGSHQLKINGHPSTLGTFQMQPR